MYSKIESSKHKLLSEVYRQNKSPVVDLSLIMALQYNHFVLDKTHCDTGLFCVCFLGL